MSIFSHLEMPPYAKFALDLFAFLVAPNGKVENAERFFALCLC